MLQLVADAYIKLLQMTVLPYVTVSIIGGLGALSCDAGAVARPQRVGAVLAAAVGGGAAAVLLFPLMFPPQQSASFFSTTLLQRRASRSICLGLYIPTEPVQLAREQHRARPSCSSASSSASR